MAAIEDPFDIERYLVPRDVPYFCLDCNRAFDSLTDQERFYAHHLAQGAWHGARILLAQTSVESVPIFDLLLALFHREGGARSFYLFAEPQIGASNANATLEYAAFFFANVGNYLSFGSTKFVPRVPCEQLEILVKASDEKHKEKDGRLLYHELEKVYQLMYGLSESMRCLAMPPSGVSSYYIGMIQKEEAQLVQEFMKEYRIEALNTLLKKCSDTHYQILVASVDQEKKATYTYQGQYTMEIVYGHFGEELKKIVTSLEKAKLVAANETQKRMFDHYIQYFSKGDLMAHRKSQIEWVKDIQPVVESNIGFIETYEDPMGVRAEFEGFVAVVDKEKSAILTQLVDQAEKFLARMPWEKEFHKDQFIRPDFTALEVLSYCTSGVPKGIKLPNYLDLPGFKNVSLTNVVSAVDSDETVKYIQEKDLALYKKYCLPACEVQVGLHELLGHGSGKVFVENEDGSYNFDQTMMNPLTKTTIKSWYKPGERYDSLFGSLASSIEECRAELAGLYLCIESEVLSLFGHEDRQEQEDVCFINWLSMIRGSVAALEYFTPSLQTWRQAHMQARFAILSTLLLHGNGVVRLEKVGKTGVEIILEREKIKTEGKKAIGDFLRKVQIFKSTANVKEMHALYLERTDASTPYWKEIRERVLAERTPRRQFVQPVTFLNAKGKVSLRNFEASVHGMIDSFLFRFPST